MTKLPALLTHLPTLKPRSATNIMAAIRNTEAPTSEAEFEAIHAARGKA